MGCFCLSRSLPQFLSLFQISPLLPIFAPSPKTPSFFYFHLSSSIYRHSPSFASFVSPFPLFSSNAFFSLSLPHLSSPFSYINISPATPYLSPLTLSSPSSLLVSSPLCLSHIPTTPLFPLSPLSPPISPGFYPGCFSSLSPIITPPLPYVPVAVPQAVGCGGRWLAG